MFRQGQNRKIEVKMLYQVSIKFRLKGRIETHYTLSPNDDLSICGNDLVGDDRDSEESYEAVGFTPERKVNCEHCLEIYNACIDHYKQKR